MKSVLILVLALLVAGAVWFFAGSTEDPTIKRVIFVTIDTLRADHLKSYGYPRSTAPFLDRLAENGVRFSNAFSASSHTAPSHTSMFTSLYPFQHAVLRNHDSIAPGLIGLAQMVEQAGFEVAAFPSVNFLEGKVGFPQIPKEHDIPQAELSGKLWYRNASTQIKRATHWVESYRTKDTFFIWLHFYDVHQWEGGGQLPEKYLETMKQSSSPELAKYLTESQNIPVSFFKEERKMLKAINSYDARLLFVDDQLREFENFLESKNLDKNTLWVITADHGEGLGNHNYAGHGEQLYNEQLHIPLIFSFSDRRLRGTTVSNLVRTIDFLPTFADLLKQDLGKREPKMQGVSLLPLVDPKNGSAAVPQFNFAQRRPKDERSFRRDWEEGELFAVQDLSRKIIDHTQGTDEFFDLENDKFEMQNRAGKDDPSEKMLRGKLEEILKQGVTLGNSAEATPAKPEELEELKALGYL